MEEKPTTEELKKRLEEAMKIKKDEKRESSVVPIPPSSLEFGETKKELEKCQKEKEEFLLGWKKERASFLNYKKEEATRSGEIMRYAKEELIKKMLPILDSVEIAEKRLTKELKYNQWVEGLLKIRIQILDFLKKEGVEEMKVLGKKFDPHFHEALEEVEKPGFESGIIVEEIKKGYFIQGKIIRPAKVKIAK